MSSETTLNKPNACETACRQNDHEPSTARPQYRVEKTADGVALFVALPGVSKDNLKLSLEEGTLTVSANRHDEVPEQWKTLQRLHRPGDYKLAVRLHPDLDPSTIEAKLADGVLRLDIERHESAKPRTIEVN